MTITLVLALIVTSQAVSTPEELLQVIDAAHGDIKDIYCEYEGEFWVDLSGLAKDRLSPDLAYEIFSGILAFKKPDSHLIDIFHERRTTEGGSSRHLLRETILCVADRTEKYSRADESEGSAEVRRQSINDIDDMGSFGRVYLMRKLRRLLLYDKKKLYMEGSERIDERPCLRFALTTGKPPFEIGGEGVGVSRFWIDLERNANVVKFETVYDNATTTRYANIKLDKFETSGGPIWFPVSGEREAYQDGRLVNFDRYRVIGGSLRANRGIDKSQFSIKYKIGMPIADRLRGAIYEYGQDLRPPPTTTAESQSRLEEALKQAEAARKELRAASWSRDGGSSWLVWSLILIGAGAMALTTIVWLRSRS